jgi:hypothetical protein
MHELDETGYWPGTNIRKSTDNAFTAHLHPIARDVRTPHRKKPTGGFAANKGTMYGFGKQAGRSKKAA